MCVCVVLTRLSMEQDENERYSTRKFGFIEVVWEIKNCFFACYKKDWEICSPKFTINCSYLSTWRLILKASKNDDSEEYAASIYLERLKSAGFTGSVRAYWCLECPLIDGFVVCDSEGVFKRGDCRSGEIKNFKLLRQKLQGISSEKVCIAGHILVNSTKDTTIFQSSKDLGLETLSKELGVLFTTKDYHDLKINIGEETFKCHKAILSARCKMLDEYIDKHNGEFELNGRSLKSVPQIFSYLYSGDLKYVLRTPTTTLDYAIYFFSIKQLETYYSKDFITLNTKFEERTFFFDWRIMNINSEKGNFVRSPIFGNRNSDIVLKYRMRLELNKDSEEIDYLGIFLETVEGSISDELYFKFDILDTSEKKTMYSRTKRWSSEEGGDLGFKDFVSKNVLKEPCVVGNGNLCISCLVFIPTGSTNACVVSSSYCFLCDFNYEEHYLLLSKQIATLFETGKHSDLNVKCRDECFRAHKCILSARSVVLAKAIRELDDHETCFTITAFEPYIIRIVLDYIYSGILRNCKLSDVFKIYSFAETYCMGILKNQCTEIIQNNFQIQNVLKALLLAKSTNNSKLKISSFEFIIPHYEEVKKQGDWKQIKEDTILCEELDEYVKNHCARLYDF